METAPLEGGNAQKTYVLIRDPRVVKTVPSLQDLVKLTPKGLLIGRESKIDTGSDAENGPPLLVLQSTIKEYQKIVSRVRIRCIIRVG